MHQFRMQLADLSKCLVEHNPFAIQTHVKGNFATWRAGVSPTLGVKQKDRPLASGVRGLNGSAQPISGHRWTRMDTDKNTGSEVIALCTNPICVHPFICGGCFVSRHSEENLFCMEFFRV